MTVSDTAILGNCHRRADTTTATHSAALPPSAARPRTSTCSLSVCRLYEASVVHEGTLSMRSDSKHASYPTTGQCSAASTASSGYDLSGRPDHSLESTSMPEKGDTWSKAKMRPKRQIQRLLQATLERIGPLSSRLPVGRITQG